MPDNSVIANAAQNKPQDVEFCGHTYQLRLPGQRQSDVMLGEIFQILNECQILEVLNAESNLNALGLGFVGKILTAMPRILDWLYDALKVPKADCKAIDDKHDLKEVMDALGEVVKILQAPFAGGTKSTDPPKEEPESSTNGETATP